MHFLIRPVPSQSKQKAQMRCLRCAAFEGRQGSLCGVQATSTFGDGHRTRHMAWIEFDLEAVLATKWLASEGLIGDATRQIRVGHSCIQLQ